MWPIQGALNRDPLTVPASKLLFIELQGTGTNAQPNAGWLDGPRDLGRATFLLGEVIYRGALEFETKDIFHRDVVSCQSRQSIDGFIHGKCIHEDGPLGLNGWLWPTLAERSGQKALELTRARQGFFGRNYREPAETGWLSANVVITEPLSGA